MRLGSARTTTQPRATELTHPADRRASPVVVLDEVERADGAAAFAAATLVDADRGAPTLADTDFGAGFVAGFDAASFVAVDFPPVDFDALGFDATDFDATDFDAAGAGFGDVAFATVRLVDGAEGTGDSTRGFTTEFVGGGGADSYFGR